MRIAWERHGEGPPLLDAAARVVERTDGMPVIGVGGVRSAEDVRRGMEDSTGRRATTTTVGDERILSVSVPGRVHQMVRVDRRAVAMTAPRLC